MAKFHINQKDGNVGVCRAENGRCPFGGDEVHFTSLVAAAEAYEKSMEAELVPSVKKAPKAREPFVPPTLVTPADYEVTREDLSSYELNEINGLTSVDQEHYLAARSSSPAITHFAANNLAYYMNKAEDAVGAPAYNEFEKTISGSEYDKRAAYVNHVLGKGTGYFSTQKPLAEVEANLWANTERLITSTRRHGFPEDERDNYNMDQSEDAHLKALSVFTGKDPKELRTQILANIPVERKGLDKVSDKDLKERADHLNGLVRLTHARKLQKKELNRELAIRRIEASEDGWEQAKLEFRNRDVELTRNEVTAILGTPEPSRF